jgi:Transposase DDE domain
VATKPTGTKEVSSLMDLSTFIIGVFCLLDDRLDGKRVRQRGPAPKLSDSEVITMEVVGEFLGIDTDKGIYEFFSRHYGEWFPKLKEVHRTTFARQATNLWKVKEGIWLDLLEHELLLAQEAEEPLLVIDSFPMAVCKESRSYKCRVMRDLAERGRDTNLGKFLGMRAHVLILWPGIIVKADVCGANVHDTHLAERLLEGMGRGWVLADRNYWSPELREQLHDVEGGPMLMARFKRKNETEKERGLVWPRWLSAKRQKIESVFSQLVSRFNMKRVRTKDAWHFSSRFMRKILSHTMAVVFCRREGLPPTRFWQLLTD